jgi:hypothetical protein
MNKVIAYIPIAIIIAALFVSAPRLASALAFVEPPFMGFPVELLTGPAFGITAAGTTVYVWHIYQQRKRLKLAPLLLAGWIGLLALIALIIVPGMVLEVRSSPLADLLSSPLDVLWCVALSVSSEVVVALAALASALSEKQSKKSERTDSQEQKQSDKGDGHKPQTCPHCERVFSSKQALSAHLRWCEQKESQHIAR